MNVVSHYKKTIKARNVTRREEGQRDAMFFCCGCAGAGVHACAFVCLRRSINVRGYNLQTLSLRVAGANALPYVEMIKRREQLAFYAQVSKRQGM